MKILQIIYESPRSPFGFGGAGVRAYEIYRRLKDRHDITLLCMKHPGAKDGELDGLNHVFVGAESGSLTKSVLSYTIKAAEHVRKHGNDFDVIIENFLPSTPFFAKFLTKTPVILQIQGIMEKHSLKKFSPLYSVPMYAAERFYPTLYDRFIFVSEVTKKKMMDRITGKIASCHVIPNGVNEELLNSNPEEGDYILFLSRIDIYTKGLDLLAKAFTKIGERYPGLRLVLAGYEFDKVDSLLSGVPSPLRERIHFAGFVTGAEKRNLLSRAKLLVLPSRHESAPISILEAAACAKPVVVSDIPELSYVRDAGFGLTFPSGSAEGLIHQIDFLLHDSGHRTTMGIKGRIYASTFLWGGIARQFEDVLHEAVRQ